MTIYTLTHIGPLQGGKAKSVRVEKVEAHSRRAALAPYVSTTLASEAGPLKSLDATVTEGARNREAAYVHANQAASDSLRSKYRKNQGGYKNVGHASNGNSGKAVKKKNGTTVRSTRTRVRVLEDGKARMRWAA